MFINTRAVGLLGVDGKVFGGDTCALALHAIDIGGGNLTRQQGVFGVVLEVATAEGVAMEVHARAEDDVTAVFLGLVTDGLTHLSDEFGVPGRSETGTDGEGGGVESLVGAFAGGVDAHTGRTIGKDGGGDAQSGNGGRCTGGSGYEVGLATNGCLVAEECVSTANEKSGFFFKGHSLKYLVDIVGAELGLSICCHNECGC